MSAYVVSKAHIATIVEYAGEVLGLRDSSSPEGATARLANALAAENTASVNHRYDERGEPYQFKDDAEVAKLAQREWFQPMQMLRAVGCLEYQSCEHPDWKKSEAFHFLNEVRARTVSRLPGYGDGADHVAGGGCPPGMQARLRGQNFGLRMAAALEAREAAGKRRH